MTYHEYRFWSAVLGCNACRLSIMDERGGEHYAIVPMNGSGKFNRRARMAALRLIAEHVQAGSDPGEVKVELTDEVLDA